MTRDDLFKINAGIVKELIQGVAEYCPKAFILIISNPVNSTVPIAAEVLKGAGVFDPKKLFGVTTLDVVRAETFSQEFNKQKNPADTKIPVIGGHSGETIVPMFSQAKPAFEIPADKYDALVHRMCICNSVWIRLLTCHYRHSVWWRRSCQGQGRGWFCHPLHGVCGIPVCLNQSHNSIRETNKSSFALSVIKAAKGEKGIVEPTFVYLPGVEGGEAIAKKTGMEFLSVPVELGVSYQLLFHFLIVLLIFYTGFWC